MIKGLLALGISDRNKEVVGILDSLSDEERIANVFADSISPVLLPDMQIVSWRDRELLLINVPHLVVPYYLNSEAIDLSSASEFFSQVSRKLIPAKRCFLWLAKTKDKQSCSPTLAAIRDTLFPKFDLQSNHAL